MSSPPLLVEDADEDFFDKLVDDEFDGVPSFVPGVEFDDVQAFSNLSINEGGTEWEEDQSKDVIVASVDAPEKDILVSEESVSLVPLNPVPSNSAVESVDADGLPESTVSRSSGSKSVGIKEVQWNLFNAESADDPFASLGDNNLKADPFGSLVNNVEVDPFSNLGENLKVGFDATSAITENVVSDLASSFYAQDQDTQVYSATAEQAPTGQDSCNSQFWENAYPGWKWDTNRGEWVLDQNSEVSYLQQTAQSVVGTVTEETGSVYTWNQGVTEYPAHMVFDPQYEGWYYDTIAQEWCDLASYNPAVQSTSPVQNQQLRSWNNTNGGFPSQENSVYGDAQVSNYASENLSVPNQGGNWSDSINNYTQQNMNSAQLNYASENLSGPNQGGNWSNSTNNYTQQNMNSAQVGNYASKDLSGPNQGGNWSDSTNNYTQQNMNNAQVGNYASENLRGPNRGGNWSDSTKNYAQQNINMWQPGAVANSDSMPALTENQKMEKQYGSRDHHLDNIQGQHMGFKPMVNTSMYDQTNRNHGANDAISRFKTFVPSENSSQHFNQPSLEQSQNKLSSHDLYGSQNSGIYSPQLFQTGIQPSHNANEGRSSAGRPPHALVTFGFGGKLIVMKDFSSYVSNSAYGNLDSVGGSVSVLNIMDVVAEKNNTTQIDLGVNNYFPTLCQQSYPGPLVGGSVGAKEVSKWIDERIKKCESPHMDYRKGELLRLLLSLLKIASQNYGKLRSPFGTDLSLKGGDRPEIAVAELFASSRKNDARSSVYGAIHRCLQNVPPMEQLLVTAAEVENLLVCGKRIEALQCAQEGQLWGYAMQLAGDLGEQFYIDTAKQMAHRMLVAGSPLKTLSLLIAGQPADVFSTDNSNQSVLPGAVNVSQHHAQVGTNGMLDDWEKNLAVITANRTKGDELVILHLGDCLLKERGETIAAHMCYLLSEANFESYSDGARLCLIGADHWNFPRTYASPEAIQRTEFYEYSMVLGNSQSVLLPFQPYKIVYAYMLAEVGRLSDSLKYCQAILKSLKTNRASEVDTWKQLLSSLEERIKAHQQSGFGTKIATGKIVGKFLPFIDSTIHRMIGPPPPPVSSGNKEHDNNPMGSRVANSQSTMAMQSLMPSSEPMNAWASGGNRSMHNRSVSEPDFGRTPRQVDSSKDPSSSDSQGNAGGASRFGRIGSNLFQKTIGWVSRSRSDRQAKLGEKNKFYYDEKRKCWIEEGANPPAEEVAPPPPPTAAAFQNGMLDYNVKNVYKGDSSPANGGAELRSPPSSERSSGMPPIPPSSNQFSARGRMGVRSRYVDTFNKGTAPSASFSSPSVAVAKPLSGANAKFFIPTPTSSAEQTSAAASENAQEDAASTQDPSTSMSRDIFSSPPPPPQPSNSSIQRFPSMGNMTPSGSNGMGGLDNGNGPLSSRSRRTASWSGFTHHGMAPKGEASGMSPLSHASPNPPSMHMPMNGSGFGDDLQEVEL